MIWWFVSIGIISFLWGYVSFLILYEEDHEEAGLIAANGITNLLAAMFVSIIGIYDEGVDTFLWFGILLALVAHVLGGYVCIDYGWGRSGISRPVKVPAGWIEIHGNQLKWSERYEAFRGDRLLRNRYKTRQENAIDQQQRSLGRFRSKKAAKKAILKDLRKNKR